jgi:hypothetical protein
MNLNNCIQIKLFPNFHNKIVHLFFRHFCYTAVKSGKELAKLLSQPNFLTYLTYPTYITYLICCVAEKHQVEGVCPDWFCSDKCFLYTFKNQPCFYFVRQRALAADSGTIAMGFVRLVRAVRQQLVIYLGWLRHLYFLFISGNIR